MHVFAYVQYAVLLCCSGYGSQQNTVTQSQVSTGDTIAASTEYSPWEANSSSASQLPTLYETRKCFTVFTTAHYLAYPESD